MDPLKDVFDGERPGHSLAELGRFSGLSRFGPTGNETLTCIYGDGCLREVIGGIVPSTMRTIWALDTIGKYSK